jgi:acetyl esterase/lipase
MRLSFGLIIVAFSLTISSCTFKSITRYKNISYQESNLAAKTTTQELNIFAPRRRASLKDVLIFVHGGSWKSGKKSLYSFFGSRMARKDVVVVILDYPLSPQATYTAMATSVARGVQWVSQNIEQYGGNPKKIFISGHSAGGHLAALVAIRNEYFDSLKIKNPIRGIVLIDAAGLDMYGYLQEEKFPDNHTYLTTFTHDPQQWKEASPLYHLHPNMPPMLIYRGEKTYQSILKSTEKFIKALKEYDRQPRYYVLKGKKHVRMMTQFFRPRNQRYGEIIEFMKGN